MTIDQEISYLTRDCNIHLDGLVDAIKRYNKKSWLFQYHLNIYKASYEELAKARELKQELSGKESN